MAIRTRLIGVSLIALAAALAAHGGAVAAPGDAAEASAPSAPAVEEIVVTAEKRAESEQSVAAQLEVLGSRQIQQLNIIGFQDYQKYLPSLAFQTLGPNQTSVYLRGVSSGDNANHSGPLPTVGVYFDELPVTTIGGTLDINMYDTSRVEVLPGPQGTLYGASSEAGTIRIISNKPSTDGFAAGYSAEGDWTHGNGGYNIDGFVNIPVADDVAVRLVGWAEHTPGYIDNVYGTRTFATSGLTINNAAYVKDNENTSENVGGRASVLWTVNPNWSIEAQAIGQDQHIDGVYGYFPSVGDLEVQRFGPDSDHDKWIQAGLTVMGRIGNFDLTYAGGYFARSLYQVQDYTDYSIFYDAVYGSGASWQTPSGVPLKNPDQINVNDYHYTKYYNEFRITSPEMGPVRFIAGLFQEAQTHHIIQNQYFISDSGSQRFCCGVPPTWPQTLWLTDQMRTDRDYAAFGEVTVKLTSHLSLTGGIRGYYYDNTLFGFFGYSQAYDQLSGFTSGTGPNNENCIPGQSFADTPCVNLNKSSIGHGQTHKLNLTYKFNENNLVYFTYSTGYRPGGVNRNGAFPPYSADTLTNYELGLKTSLVGNTLVWDSALYNEDWSKFQFSFLGPNDLTVIENAPEANIKGVETAINWNPTRRLSLSGGGTYTHAVLTQNFCGTDQTTGQLIPTCPDSTAVAVAGTHLPYTPDFKGFATGRYTVPVQAWQAFGQVAVTYQTRNQVGLRTTDIQELGSMPPYATVDLSAGASRGRLIVEFDIKNLFDSRGQENRYTTCPVGVCSQQLPGVPQSIYVVPIIPRTFVLKLAQTF